MSRRKAVVTLCLAAALAVALPVSAVSSQALVADLLAKTGLSYSSVEGRADTWHLTYTGLDNLEELDIYVWARRTSFVTVFTTVFEVKKEPAKSFLWRLLELNDSMIGLKYVIRDDSENRGSYLVDCQADLPLYSLSSTELKEVIEDLVTTVDEGYEELVNLL
ncbi:MAG: hypothetical protein ACM3ZC_11020 [Bacteroidota bacterium]